MTNDAESSPPPTADTTVRPSSSANHQEGSGGAAGRDGENNKTKRAQKGGVRRRVCVPCRVRKTKCNLGHPCQQCVTRLDPSSCEYPGDGLPPQPAGASSSDSSEGTDAEARRTGPSVAIVQPARLPPPTSLLCRQAFENAFARYADVSVTYFPPVLEFGTFSGLYDLWLTYGRVPLWRGDGLALDISTPFARESLNRTFFAVASFGLGCAHSYSDELSRTGHFVQLAILLGIKAWEGIIKYQDPIPDKMLFASLYLFTTVSFTSLASSFIEDVQNMLRIADAEMTKRGLWKNIKYHGIRAVYDFALRLVDGYLERNLTQRLEFVERAKSGAEITADELQSMCLCMISADLIVQMFLGKLDMVTHQIDVMGDFNSIQWPPGMQDYMKMLGKHMKILLEYACDPRHEGNTGLERNITLLMIHYAFISFVLHDHQTAFAYADCALNRWMMGWSEPGHPCNSVPSVEFLLCLRIICDLDAVHMRSLLARHYGILNVNPGETLSFRGQAAYRRMGLLLMRLSRTQQLDYSINPGLGTGGIAPLLEHMSLQLPK